MRPAVIAVVVCLIIGLTACGGGVSNAPVVTAALAPVAIEGAQRAGAYQNPLPIQLADGTTAESCPDPSIIRGQTPGDDYWYLYCTNERFSDSGAVHLLPVSRSADMVNWTYVGDIFDRMPAWVARDGGIWAPDIQYFNGQYYLYYSASNTTRGGSAIFVATSKSPLGPWTASSTPVVEPCCSPHMRATIDSAIVSDNGQRYIFYGSFDGGISARLLSPDGLHSDPASQVQIALPDRYEASYLVQHDGYFYLMVSAGRCCQGSFSGYGVFAARSQNVLGPYVDRDGSSLLDARIGGTPVLSMNGNRWLGPGHNAVATDASGQDWILYHAVDAAKPYFVGSWTRRPVMLDRLDWIDGWPVVRGGAGPSDAVVPAPAFASGAAPATVTAVAQDSPAAALAAPSDDFSGSSLSSQWSWVRDPGPTALSVSGGALHFATQSGDIYLGSHTASVLSEPAPAADYMVEVKLSIDVPLAGNFNFAQGGLVIYQDDDNYVKLVVSSINGTRQIEFAKQEGDATQPTQYGSSFLSSPADSTYLRLVRHGLGSGAEAYTAYSSHDGVTWERGATWTHSLRSARIGLVSMSLAGFTTDFDYVRVYSLATN